MKELLPHQKQLVQIKCQTVQHETFPFSMPDGSFHNVDGTQAYQPSSLEAKAGNQRANRREG